MQNNVANLGFTSPFMLSVRPDRKDKIDKLHLIPANKLTIFSKHTQCYWRRGVKTRKYFFLGRSQRAFAFRIRPSL